jgi:hypothetical protein
LKHEPFHETVPHMLLAAQTIAKSIDGLSEAVKEATEVLKQWPAIGNHKDLTL